MRIVVALGGNALLRRGEVPDAEIQEHHIDAAVEALAPLARAHDLVVTHGNGPQVGLLAVESGSDPSLSRSYPLDVLGAQTQGMIGYWLGQSLRNVDPRREWAALVCQTVVSETDPSFRRPTKFVGQVYDEARAAELATAFGWEVRPDGSSWRRVVPSPLPVELVELPVILALLDAGICVVCEGGGGIPVVRTRDKRLVGVEAVIDKDRTAALLAEQVRADALLILTDVVAVEAGFGTDHARPIVRATPADLATLAFPEGSMGPKVHAACAFVESTGGVAGIGRLEDASAILDGTAGTVIRR